MKPVSYEDRALSVDPDHRPRRAADFARMLADALRTIPERTDTTRIAAEVATAIDGPPAGPDVTLVDSCEETALLRPTAKQ